MGLRLIVSGGGLTIGRPDRRRIDRASRSAISANDGTRPDAMPSIQARALATAIGLASGCCSTPRLAAQFPTAFLTALHGVQNPSQWQSNRSLLAPPFPAGKQVGASRDWAGIFRDNSGFWVTETRPGASISAKFPVHARCSRPDSWFDLQPQKSRLSTWKTRSDWS
jgi:hypothetical protein